MRNEIKDVQFHPVKMLLFIRFSEDKYRDEVLARIQSSEGLIWSDYRVRIKGYSLDAQVKFIRLLGVSPETGEEEIKRNWRSDRDQEGFTGCFKVAWGYKWNLGA